MSTPGGFDARGAVDLGALAAAREAQQRAEAQAEAARRAAARDAEAAGGDAAGGAGAAPAEGVYPGPLVQAVDEAGFQADVMDRSFLVPVLVDFWAEWCGPCKQLSPLLERMVAEDGGRWVLATVDVDANQRLAQAFQVQSIPTVYAVVKGQPIPLFQGAQPEPQIRQVLDQLMQVAQEQGLTGRVDGSVPAATPAAEPPHAPELDDAADAVERGDLPAAAAAYQRLLDRSPADPDARAGLALVTLLQRTEGVDANAAVAAAQADPSDVAAACTAADVLVLNRQVDAGLGLLVEAVRRTSGEDRDRAREHLVGLFDVLGDAEPAVGPARRALAAALF